VSRLAALNSGLALGLVAGAWDGVAVVLENPRSFEPASILPFLGAAVALGVAAGSAAGSIAAGLRLRPGALLVPGLSLALFAWLGVRAHVRWFFGEPPLSGPSLLANAGLLAGSVALVGAVWKVAGGVASRGAAHPAAAALALGLAAGGGTTALLFAPRPDAPLAGAVPPAGARDVLLVTLDTTRADHLSCYGYPRGTTPAIDRVARRAAVTERAYAPIPLTNPSHVSMLTGAIPREHGVLNNGTALAAELPTFVPELASAGWSCAAFVSGIPLKARLSGLAPGFRVYDDAFSLLETVHPMLTSLAAVRVANRVLPLDLVERRAAETCAAAAAWLRTSEGPRLLWVHLFDPHTPYDAPAILERRFAVESPAWTAAGRPVGGWPIAQYDAELREADRRLEDLLRDWDDATAGEGAVLLTGDHGEGLGQHGELTHGAQLFEEDLRVPLVTADPADPGPRVEVDPLPLTAVARLVRELAGLAPSTLPRAASVLCETFAPEGKRDRSAVVESGPPGRKVVLDRETGEVVGFDLASDPGETRPIRPAGEWAALVQRLPADKVDRERELDPETVRRLRALGYVH